MIEKTLDKTIDKLQTLTALILLVLAALIIYDAMMRYFFNSGSIMLQELEWHLFDIIMLFSLAVTLKARGHVRVDVFYQQFSPLWKNRINLISSIFMVIPFSMLIIYVGSSFVEMSFIQMEGSANPGGLPYRYLIKSVMVIGFVLLLLQALHDIISLLKREPKS